MSDSFYDNNASVVQYQVVFLKRDWEALLHDEMTLVTSNMDGNGLTAWKIAEFVQAMGRCEVPVPNKWLGRLDELPGKGNYQEKDGVYYMTGLREDDKKYLRITYQILDVLTREEPEYDKDQTKAVEAIANALRNPIEVKKVD